MPENYPVIVPQSPLGSTVNKIGNQSRKNTIVSSNDFIVKRDGQGTTLSLSPAAKNFPTSFTLYRGEYDPDAAYSVNDVVRVLHDTNYSTTGAETVQATVPGVYVCVADIPDFNTSNTLKGMGYRMPNYLRVDGVDYFPKWPEPTNTIDDFIAGRTNDNIHIRYWELISLLPKTTYVCENGVTKTTYVDMAESGSVAT